MSPETWFYTYVSDFSKFEHPFVSGCIKYVPYILREMLLFQSGLQLLLKNWRIYWLKLDKPVCYILRDMVIDSGMWILSLLCSNVGPLLELFLTSRGVEIYSLLSRIFFRLLFFSIYTVEMEGVTWVFLWIWTPIECAPHPQLNFSISLLLF